MRLQSRENGGTVRVGFLEGATYPAGSSESIRKKYAAKKKKGDTSPLRESKGGTSVAMVAAIQNFGAPKRGIPPRPFFSNMVRDKSPEWPDALEQNLKDTGYNAQQSLSLMGEGIKGQLQQSIRDTTSPPNSQVTIDRKGFNSPLIDSGHMLNSVDYEVDK